MRNYAVVRRPLGQTSDITVPRWSAFAAVAAICVLGFALIWVSSDERARR